jgi:hypothetical protein
MAGLQGGVTVELASYPPIDRMKFVQGSDATPGRAVFECSTEWTDPLPRITDLMSITIQPLPANPRVWVGGWKDMRAINCRRSRFGNIHVVFEDSRWILREYKMEQNFNERCSCGFIYSGTQRTIGQLVDEISKAAGNRLRIVTGSNVPSFKPPARWANKTCMEALQDLLDNTGCRMVYAPENQTYVVDLANSSQVPKFPHEVYQPAPKNTLKTVRFWTAPKLYEERETANAVTINDSTGEAENITSGETLDSQSSQSVGDNAQTEFRLWKPASSDKKLYVQHRVKSLLADPLNPRREQGRIIRGPFEPFPVHQPMIEPAAGITGQIELTSGGVVFTTEHPVLAADGGNIATTATLLTGHYKKSGSEMKGLERDSETRNIDGGHSGVVDEFVEWIKPISSSEPDVSSTDYWGDLFKEVCDALVNKFTPFGGELARTVTTPQFYQLAGSSQVGCVEYEFQTHRYNKRHHMRIALNFTPGGVGNVR